MTSPVYLQLDLVIKRFDCGIQKHPHLLRQEKVRHLFVFLEHTHWVLCVKWSHDSNMLASGGMDSIICIWDRNFKCTTRLKGHTKWITSLSWEQKESSSLLVSGSKDSTARVWNARSGECISVLSQHTDSITSVKWSTSGVIFTASRDRTIKMWTPQVLPFRFVIKIGSSVENVIWACPLDQLHRSE